MFKISFQDSSYILTFKQNLNPAYLSLSPPNHLFHRSICRIRKWIPISHGSEMIISHWGENSHRFIGEWCCVIPQYVRNLQTKFPVVEWYHCANKSWLSRNSLDFKSWRFFRGTAASKVHVCGVGVHCQSPEHSKFNQRVSASIPHTCTVKFDLGIRLFELGSITST